MRGERHRPIIDAGPGLNFFSINKERLLISILGRLSAPEAVQAEVFRKAASDERFRPAAVWRKLTPRWIDILPNQQTPELTATIYRISGEPVAQRLARSKDLGEFMVVAHAVAAAEAGAAVTVLIDDGQGARTATTEINRLRRLRTGCQRVGSIRLVSTLGVLELVVGGPHIPDRCAMRAIYGRLRCLDDGLPPIDRTTLLTSGRWSRGAN